MDSDERISEDDEARLYSMLYYVDSKYSTNKSHQDDVAIVDIDETKENNEQTKNDEIDITPHKNDIALENSSSKSNDAVEVLVLDKDSNSIKERNEDIIKEKAHQSSPSIKFLEIENEVTKDTREDCEAIIIKRPKQRISQPKRYWVEDKQSANSCIMYVRINNNNNQNKKSKQDNTIITLSNTRGKRKSLEICSNPNDAEINGENVKNTPAKQSRPTLASHASVNQDKLINSSNKLKEGILSSDLDKNNSKLPPETKKKRKRVKKSAKNKIVKNPFANDTSKSIIIESSDDDDSVIEVELPQLKETTIDLDSSDESQTEVISQEYKDDKKDSNTCLTKSMVQDDKRSNSPVPSIVSSTSDDFIQADCSNLNITEGNSSFVFNFQLHGSEFSNAQIDKNRCETSTPLSVNQVKGQNNLITSSARLLNIEEAEYIHVNEENSHNRNENFATPKSKNKKNNVSRIKNYSVSADAYALPSADVFESESSDIPESVVDVPITNRKKKRKSICREGSVDSTTDNVDSSNLIMANVIGISTCNEVEEVDLNTTIDSGNSSQKQNEKTLKKSANEVKNRNEKPTYLARDFDHIKIKNQMPKDRDLWRIDPSDRVKPRKVSVQCGFCNKKGHRSETCFRKPSICSMCGGTGHKDTRCPNKICLNCGNPNNAFSVDCQNCKSWKNIYCGTCRDYGHPPARCPDIWRRYHLTICNEIPLVECKKRKTKSSLHCSGCAKKGHIINDCNNYIKFSNFKAASPYIFHYTAIYTPDAVRNVPSSEALDVVQLEKESNERVNQKQNSDCRESKTKKPEFPLNKPKSQSKERDSKQRSQESTNRPRTPSIGYLQDDNVASSSDTLTVSSMKADSKEYPVNKDDKNPGDQTSEQYSGSKSMNHVLSQIKQLNSPDSSLIFISKHHANILVSRAGNNYLKELSDTYEIAVNISTDENGATIELSGNKEKHADLQRDLQQYLNANEKVFIDDSRKKFIPRGKKMALRKLYKEMSQLKYELGNPQSILSQVEKLKYQANRRRFLSKPDSKSFKKICKDIKKGYRLLNMILIGQAKLKNGNETFAKLEKMIKFLEGQNYKILSDQLRNEIGTLYASIFSSSARADYPELIKMYDLSNTHPMSHHKNKHSTGVSRQELLKMIISTKENYYTIGGKALSGNKALAKGLKCLKKFEKRVKYKTLSPLEMASIKNLVHQYNKKFYTNRGRFRQIYN